MLRRLVLLLLISMVCVAADPKTHQPALSRNSRGYVTTPQELARIAEKASLNQQPYNDAVDQLVRFAGSPKYWPFGSISGEQYCTKTLEPGFLGHGSPLIEAKAMAFHLTEEREYAAAVREKLLELPSTFGYGGNNYSGSNQCILNLSWYLPGFIIAADLIEGYEGWSESDKRSFQRWLAKEAYPKVEWASDVRSNNWGAAGSATAAMIADYLVDYPGDLHSRTGDVSVADAYRMARQRQLDRFDGNSYMDNYGCVSARGQGIRPDGGIPFELVRGTSGCDAGWIKDLDSSWIYLQTFMQGAVMHAELLLRRGDTSLYTNETRTGAGSLLRAVHFLIENPAGKSVPWNEPNGKQTLELTYRYYRDRAMAEQLRVGRKDRYIGGKSGQMLHFGTITHAFAVGEDPGYPPSVSPPGAPQEVPVAVKSR